MEHPAITLWRWQMGVWQAWCTVPAGETPSADADPGGEPEETGPQDPDLRGNLGDHPKETTICLGDESKQILVPSECVDPGADVIDPGEEWIQCETPGLIVPGEEWR